MYMVWYVLRDSTATITSQHIPWQTSKYLRGVESESLMDTHEARASRMVDGAPEAFTARWEVFQRPEEIK